MTGSLMERLDDIPKPAWIALLVVSFILFWPIGLALLIYLKWSGRMFCSRRYGHWSGADGREARREAREEWRAWKRRHRWGHSSSGNVETNSEISKVAGVKTPATKHTANTTAPNIVEPAIYPAQRRHMKDSSFTTRYVSARPLSAIRNNRGREITIMNDSK